MVGSKAINIGLGKRFAAFAEMAGLPSTYKEKAAIANLDESKVPLLQYAFDVYLTDQLGMNEERNKDVMHRIWKVLQKPNRIQRVKRGGQAWTGPAQGGRRMKNPFFRWLHAEQKCSVGYQI